MFDSNLKILFILRAGSPEIELGKETFLSGIGKDQVIRLADYIYKELQKLNKDFVIDIYGSSSKKAEKSAEIIKNYLYVNKLHIEKFLIKEELFSDYLCEVNLDWIKSEILDSKANVIIIVGDIELAHWLPQQFGYKKTCAKSGEGIMVLNPLNLPDVKKITFTE